MLEFRGQNKALGKSAAFCIHSSFDIFSIASHSPILEKKRNSDYATILPKVPQSLTTGIFRQAFIFPSATIMVKLTFGRYILHSDVDKNVHSSLGPSPKNQFSIKFQTNYIF